MAHELTLVAGRSLASLRRWSSCPTVVRHLSLAKLATEDEARQFMAVFPDLERDLSFDKRHIKLPDLSHHLAKTIQYNVPSGKKNRGLAVVNTVKTLTRLRANVELDEDALYLAQVLGWCVEFMQAFLLVADDIMDGSEMRRGRPAWHVHAVQSVYKSHVQDSMPAFNDALLLETCIYTLLAKYFHDAPYYYGLVEEFRETSRLTTLGQCLDLISTASTTDGNHDLTHMTMDRYDEIVKLKTSNYSFVLPVKLGMRMAGLTDPKLFERASRILQRIGHLFQVQDDILDVYGDSSTTGKIGTDITDGKCSWLIVVALQRASADQRRRLTAAYGTDQTAEVKAVFDELKLFKLFQTYEKEMYDEIMLMIDQTPGEGRILPPSLFTIFLDKLYRRVK